MKEEARTFDGLEKQKWARDRQLKRVADAKKNTKVLAHVGVGEFACRAGFISGACERKRCAEMFDEVRGSCLLVSLPRAR